MTIQHLNILHQEYYVCLTVTDLNECEESYCDTVIVRPNPVAEIEVLYDCFPEPGCSNEISSFNSLSILDSLGGSLDSALWYIDFNLEESLIETDTFDNIFSSGQYNVELTVISNYNCIDTDSVIIDIVDIPISNFSLSNDTICVGDSIFITENNSSGYILNYQWVVYGNENDTLFEYNSSDSLQPLLPFLPQGLNDTTYIISLTTTNCCGSNTYYDTLLVEPLPIVDFAMTDSIICSGNTVGFNLEPFIFGGTDSLIVDYGDGVIITVLPDTIPPFVWDTIQHQYYGDLVTGQDTTYYITITGYNGCGSTSSIDSIVVKPNELFHFSQQIFGLTPTPVKV